MDVYESLDDYVEEVSSKASPNVKLENVQNLLWRLLNARFACVRYGHFSVQTTIENQTQTTWRFGYPSPPNEF